MKKRFLLLLFLLVHALHAQKYPVQITPVLVPPYLASLSSYSTTMNEKLSLQLYVSDLTLTRRQVYLKLYIEGNGIQATSAPFVEGIVPLFLSGGDAVQLTQADLAPYFKIQNLQGISPAQYGKPLPQGMYKFCAELYDFYSREKIAQKSCAMGYFMVNSPPQLNLPANHESIDSKSFQNIFFSWTPRHISAGNVEYEFTLVELLDPIMPSGSGFFVSRPLYQTTTPTPSLLYGPAEPLLLPGKKYAWRVQARTTSGFGDGASFENDGYSEIYDFTFKGDCDKPQFVLAEPKTNTQVKVSWQQNPNHTHYMMQTRKKGTTEWFEGEGDQPTANINDLEAGQSYEFRVGAYCMDNVLSFSSIIDFTMPAKKSKDFQCGLEPNIDLSNQTRYSGTLKKGQEFMAGDFAVHVLEATGTDTFTGKAWIKVPYLGPMRIAVEFKDIQLNTNLQLLAGEVKTTYDPEWKNILDVNEVIDEVDDSIDAVTGNEDVHDVAVNFTVGDVNNIKVEDGKIKITNPATGEVAKVLDFDKGEVTTIRDKDGNVYNVDKNGEVTKQGDGAGQSTAENTQGVDAKGAVTQIVDAGYKVVFSPLKNPLLDKTTQGASDQKPQNASGELAKLYKTIRNADGTDYDYLYQAVSEQDKTDYVVATLEGSGKKAGSKPKLVFKANASTLVKVVDSTNIGGKPSYILELKAFNSAGRNEISAVLKGAKPADKDQVIGAMMQIDIKQNPAQNVVVVPVNGASVPSNIETKVNEIYQGTGGSFKISLAENYQLPDRKTLDCGKSGWFANYTDEQNAFIAQYATQHPLQDSQRYVFVMKDIAPSRSLSGFMPLGRQVGFLFPASTGEEAKLGALEKLLAHELGHGVYELQHPWENNNIPKGSTDWLMDYADGTQLSYIHWEQISHPKFIVPFLKGDASGEISNRLFKDANGKYFSSGKDISVAVCLNSSEVQQANLLPNGTVYAFHINDKMYYAQKESDKYIYKTKEGESITLTYVAITSSNQKDAFTVYYPSENKVTAKDYLGKNVEIIGVCSGSKFLSLQQEKEFNVLWELVKNCFQNYKNQKEGYVPRCLWDHNLYAPNGPFAYYINDPAFIAGVVDGLVGTVDGSLDLLKFANCFDPTSFKAWTDKECFSTREKTIMVLQQMYLVLSNTEKLSEATESIKGKVGDYFVETGAVNNQARYNQGKLVFDVASLFVGVGEAKALINGEKTLALVLKEGLSAYAALPKSILKLTQRVGREGVAYIALKAGNKGAYLGYKLANTEIKLADVTAQQVFANIEWATKNGIILEKIEDVKYLDQAGKELKGTLELVKQEDGKLGVKVSGIKFIARTGEELKTYLNALSDLPKGITFEGKMYRNIPHREPAFDPSFIMRTTSSDIDNRFITGLYLSEEKSGNIYEAIHYTGGTANRDLFEFTNVKVDKLLDLSNEQNLEKLGTTLEDMMKVGTDKDYEFTNVIAKWAKEKGYKGVKFKGARGNGIDYINFVIFEESTVSKSLNNYKKINW